MRFIIKPLFVLLMLLVIAVGGAAAGLWFYGDELLGHYKPDIERALSDALNVSVEVGELRATIVPRLSLRIDEMKVHTPDNSDVWTVEHAALVAELQALLERRLELSSIIVSGLSGTVHLNTTAAQPASSPAQDSASRAPFVLNLHDFRIEKSLLRFTDGKTEWPLDIHDGSGRLSTDGDVLRVPTATLNASISGMPAALGLSLLEMKPDGAVSLGELALSIDGQALRCGGSMGADGRMKLSASGSQLDLAQLASTLARFQGKKPFAVAGRLSASVSLTGTVTDLTATGRLSAQSIRSASARISSIDIPQWTLATAGGALQSISSDLSLAGLEIRNGAQSYVAESGKSKLTARNGKGWSITGTVDAVGFGYADEATRLSRVNATATGVNAVITPRGDIVVDLQAQGRSLVLLAPSVEVSSIEQASAPLRISVPASGGYSVSGPVTASGGVVTLEGRKLERVEGTVAMLVSGPLKDFSSKALKVVSGGERLQAQLSFSMTDQAFKASLSPLKIGDGELFASWYMGRDKDLRTTIDARATRIKIAPAYAAVMQERKPVDGLLDNAALSIKGERERLPQSAVGTGSFVFLGEPPKKILPTDTILNAIASIPGAGNLLVAKDTLDNSRDREMKGDVRIADGKVSVQNFTARRTGFNLAGKASIGFDQRLDGAVSVVFFKETLRSLSFNITLLSNLFSSAPQISIPLIISGTIDNPGITPDYAEIAKNASGLGLAQSVAQGILSGGKRVLSVFDRSSSSSSSSAAAQGK